MDADHRHDSMARRLEQTRRVTAGFEGLAEEVARVKTADHPDVQFEFLSGGGVVTHELRSNRVRLVLRDGRVVRASAG